MLYISERIININELEKQIQNAKLHFDMDFFSFFSLCRSWQLRRFRHVSQCVGERWLYRATGSNPGVLIAITIYLFLMRSVEIRGVLHDKTEKYN